MSEAEIRRLFDAKVASAWDWSSGRRGDLEAVRQTVLDVAAGRLDESALTAVAERVAGNPAAAQTLTGQCRTVIREAGRAMTVPEVREGSRVRHPEIIGVLTVTVIDGDTAEVWDGGIDREVVPVSELTLLPDDYYAQGGE